MTDLAILLESQKGLNWRNWQRFAGAVEELGFAALYRSEHFVYPTPPDCDSLDLWSSLTWLASHTRRIEFGPLVSPVSMRHPVLTARAAIDVDNLSGGRLRLGLGAGWVEREHRMFGFALGEMKERFARFDEALHVITHLLRSDEPLTFNGQFYQLEEAHLIPRPERPGGTPIVIGGRGPLRTLPLVVKYADEWNTFRIPLEQVASMSARLNELLAQAGRDPASLRRSMMIGVVFGRSEAEVRARMGGASFEALREKNLVGTPSQIVDQIGEYQRLGIQRMILQWFDAEDLDLLEQIATSVLPQLA